MNDPIETGGHDFGRDSCPPITLEAVPSSKFIASTTEPDSTTSYEQLEFRAPLCSKTAGRNRGSDRNLGCLAQVPEGYRNSLWAELTPSAPWPSQGCNQLNIN